MNSLITYCSPSAVSVPDMQKLVFLGLGLFVTVDVFLVSGSGSFELLELYSVILLRN